jgi:hypothetical protein
MPGSVSERRESAEAPAESHFPLLSFQPSFLFTHLRTYLVVPR